MLRHTPLFSRHRELGARFTEFGGWEMPVQYSGLVDEHLNTRAQAGLFDVSHMGEVWVTGPHALSYLDRVTCNDPKRLEVGQAQYSLLLNERGGVVDDIIVYRLGEQEYLLCVNAANVEKDYEWLQSQNGTQGSPPAELANRSADYGQVALQGPDAWKIAAQVFANSGIDFAIEFFPGFGVRRTGDVIIARTGYTGEDGFEIFAPNDQIGSIWDAIIECGGNYGLKPVGLGARDTLRLEACLPLYGHELKDDVTVLESGFGWVVKLDKGDFIGRDALAKQKERGLPRKLVGLEVTGAGIVREAARISTPSGQLVGESTSGTKPPTVNRAIALAIVDSEFSAVGTELLAEVRGKQLPVKVVKLPFYRRPRNAEAA